MEEEKKEGIDGCSSSSIVSGDDSTCVTILL